MLRQKARRTFVSHQKRSRTPQFPPAIASSLLDTIPSSLTARANRNRSNPQRTNLEFPTAELTEAPTADSWIRTFSRSTHHRPRSGKTNIPNILFAPRRTSSRRKLFTPVNRRASRGSSCSSSSPFCCFLPAFFSALIQRKHPSNAALINPRGRINRKVRELTSRHTQLKCSRLFARARPPSTKQTGAPTSDNSSQTSKAVAPEEENCSKPLSRPQHSSAHKQPQRNSDDSKADAAHHHQTNTEISKSRQAIKSSLRSFGPTRSRHHRQLATIGCATTLLDRRIRRSAEQIRNAALNPNASPPNRSILRDVQPPIGFALTQTLKAHSGWVSSLAFSSIRQSSPPAAGIAP